MNRIKLNSLPAEGLIARKCLLGRPFNGPPSARGQDGRPLVRRRLLACAIFAAQPSRALIGAALRCGSLRADGYCSSPSDYRLG